MSVHPKTTTAFSDFAEAYLAEDCAGLPLVELPEVAGLVSKANLGDVLCVGCGGGAECASLQKRAVRSLVGIDHSPRMIEIARRDHPNCQFQLGDIESIPFADGAFDLIYCAHVLHYLRDWTHALAEIGRVLRKDGQLIVTLHHPIDWVYSGRSDETLVTSTGSAPVPTDYLRSQVLHARWYGTELVCYHRPLAEMINQLVSQRLNILECVEASIPGCPHVPLYVAFRLRQSR